MASGRASESWALPYGGVATLALGLTVLAAASPRRPFAPYLGDIPPLSAIFVAAILGLAALAFLTGSGWVRPAGWRSLRTVAPTAALLALAFAVPTVAVDSLWPWPAGINVPLPVALAFYPAIGFFVDITFHLLPLALAVMLAHVAGLRPSGPAFWALALPALLTEPAFQVAFGLDTGGPGWRDVYLALHLLGFATVQLHMLRRHGFAAAYMFRLVYYLVWHILWGGLRLGLLF